MTDLTMNKQESSILARIMVPAVANNYRQLNSLGSLGGRKGEMESDLQIVSYNEACPHTESLLSGS